MRDAEPSRTAMRVAARRAAHQMIDSPRVLEDPVAPRIIGAGAVERLATARLQHSASERTLRAFVVARSRFAEDELARAVARGVDQYVVLGAGLDTFAYRNPHLELGVFEVDFPATQAWKRRRLAETAIPIPPTLTFAPVDFEHQTLAAGLAGAGFDSRRPAFFSWLGVTMYLTDSAIDATLRFVSSLPPGGGIVFDYAVPRANLNWLERLAFDRLSRRVAAAGEPFITLLDPTALTSRLADLGFHAIEDLGRDEINTRYFPGRRDGLRVRGRLAHIVSTER